MLEVFIKIGEALGSPIPTATREEDEFHPLPTFDQSFLGWGLTTVWAG